MRNVLLTFALLLCFGLSYGQIKVVTSGDTGIGTSTPQAKLHVDGETIIENGFLGVGTTSPGRILHLNTVGQGTGAVARSEADANTDAKYEFWENGTEFWEFGMKGNVAGNPFRIGPNTSGATRFEMISNCNLGLGVLNAAFTLQVAGDAAKSSGGNTWIVASDKRLKNNIKEFTDGLNVILKMNPVSFKYNEKVSSNREKNTEIGIIAQEMQKIAPYTVKKMPIYTYEFPENSDSPEKIISKEEYLAYDGNALQYIIVNAIQEQQTIIDEKDAQIDALTERLAALEEVVLNLSNNSNNSTQNVEIKNASLGQNAPNPFTEATVINYSVPAKAQTAVMQVFNMNGQLLKTVNVAKGNGQLTINAGELAAGAYSYNLIVDGEVIDTKKMVLTK